MHNQHGSWLARTADGHKEPKRDIAFALQERLLIEMKALGIPTVEEKLRQREEEERAARKKHKHSKTISED
jgi:hypothetical protein